VQVVARLRRTLGPRMFSPPMRFTLIDSILEQTPERIRAVKQVSLAEEYLADHFPDFPVLPGVMMVEAIVQAGRHLLAERTDERLVLGSVRALKFGNMVRPGEQLEVELTLQKANDDGSFDLKATGRVRRRDEEPQTAVSGKITMRPVRVAAAG